MADAKGSSAGGAGAGHGDLGGAISHDPYQAFLASVHRTAPGAANVYQHHQYPAGLIPAPVAMPVHVTVPRTPFSPQIAVPPPRPLAPPPEHRAQSQPPAGRYQDYSPHGNIASSQYPRGFADWGTHSNALTSFSHATSFGSSSSNMNSNGFRQNLSPYPTHTWTTNYVPMNTYSASYAPATKDMVQAASFHNNNHAKDSGAGFATGFRMAPSVVPASPFQLLSPKSIDLTSAQLFQEMKNSEETPRVFGSSEIESENSEELDPTPTTEVQNVNQGSGDMTAFSVASSEASPSFPTPNVLQKLYCKDYRTVVRKDLTNSDVGNIGRIVLPKRDAEPNLPFLEEKDGVILEMDDFQLPDVWKFKYRFWPNNKSRMYILETTGEFVKKHGLRAKDILIIYKNKRTGRYVARAVKVEQDMPWLECECMKQGNSSEECGFAVSPSTKKT